MKTLNVIFKVILHLTYSYFVAFCFGLLLIKDAQWDILDIWVFVLFLAMEVIGNAVIHFQI